MCNNSGIVQYKFTEIFSLIINFKFKMSKILCPDCNQTYTTNEIYRIGKE